VLELREWIATVPFDARPWLVLGKGPTFAHHARTDLASFNLLSLNHAVRELRVDVAHMIDIDVVEACAECLADNCRWLVMPRVPHIQQRPGPALLEDYVEALEVLQKLDAEDRLVWYNAETAAPVGNSPVMEVRYFSSEAALSILGALGAKRVRSLGVDGGTAYSPTFSELAQTTRLANGQPSFDLQFAELDRIAARHGIDYSPLVPVPTAVHSATPQRGAPARSISGQSAASVALTAAFRRIDQLERRSLRAKLRRSAAPLRGLARRARAMGPSSRWGQAVERAGNLARRALR
jgi:hypothetical protein